MKATCLLYDSKGNEYPVTVDFNWFWNDEGKADVFRCHVDSMLASLSGDLYEDVKNGIAADLIMRSEDLTISCEITHPIEEKLTINKAA